MDFTESSEAIAAAGVVERLPRRRREAPKPGAVDAHDWDIEAWGHMADAGLIGTEAVEAWMTQDLPADYLPAVARACGRAALVLPIVEAFVVEAIFDGPTPYITDAQGVALGCGHQWDTKRYVTFVPAADITWPDADGRWWQGRGEAPRSVGTSCIPTWAIDLKDDVQECSPDRLAGGTGSRVAVAAEMVRVAYALGIAERALADCLLYTASRSQFDKRLSEFQAVQHHLANMAVAIHSIEAAVLLLADGHYPRPADATELVRVALQQACVITSTAVQLHGGYGFVEESDVQIYWRLTRQLRSLANLNAHNSGLAPLETV